MALTLSIDGIEVTQAIQYYHSSNHLTDPSDQNMDNSVRFVTGKPAWVRVYVRSKNIIGDIPNVTGTLEISRRRFGIPSNFSMPQSLNPQPPGKITARQNINYAIERETLDATLNFIIPANKMCGKIMLRAIVNGPYGDSAESTIFIDVTLQQTLRVRGIMVGYNGKDNSGNNIVLAAPTLVDLQTTSAWTLLTYPIASTAIYSSGGQITWSLPLTDAPSCNGCCTPNWDALNVAVQAQRVADGNKTDVLYYGLMAAGIPMGQVIGCNSGEGGISTGSNGDVDTMAHELGHACGLPHAPCGTTGDPNYPAYEPYDPSNSPNASIGEYGLDINNGAIFSPSIFKDMMAYCGPKWISLYNYGRLTNNAQLNPIHICAEYLGWPKPRNGDLFPLTDPQGDPELPEIPDIHPPGPHPYPDPRWRDQDLLTEPVISIIGIMQSEDEIEIKSIMRTYAVPIVKNSIATDMTAELMGEGEILARATVYRLRSISSCICNQGGIASIEKHYPSVFQVFLPDKGQGTSLRIRRRDKEIWTRKAPTKKPLISHFEAQVKDEEIEVVWQLEASGEQEVEFWIKWSNNKGINWHGLASGLHGRNTKVSVSSVPPGHIALLLLASDGFYTAESNPITIMVPDRVPSVSILTPHEGQILAEGKPMRLWGAITSHLDKKEKALEILWLIDGKEISKELDAFITAPPSGKHKIILNVKYGDQLAKASATFVSVELPSEGGYTPKSFRNLYMVVLILLAVLLLLAIVYQFMRGS